MTYVVDADFSPNDETPLSNTATATAPPGTVLGAGSLTSATDTAVLTSDGC